MNDLLARWRWTALASVALLACASFGRAQPAARTAGTLRILARYPVAAAPSPPTDVRWASASSIFLARFTTGVSEVRLTEGLPEARPVLRSADVLGAKTRLADTRFFESLATSEGSVMTASLSRYRAWTSIAPTKDGTRSISRWTGGVTTDLDVHRRSFVVLGESGTHERPWKDGAIAWLGSLDSGPQKLRPILYDAGGPDNPGLNRCQTLELGGVRFLADGSVVVAPGSEPGVHLYGPGGDLVRSWDTARLGLERIRCSALTDEEMSDLDLHPDRRLAWLNAHRIVDEILPLPQGPGLVLRWRGADGTVHWQLAVLGATGIATFDLPFTSDRPFDRLRGDVQDGRIVLLRSAHTSFLPAGRDAPGEVVVTEVPR